MAIEADNHDGHHANHSDNFGVEGETDDPMILAGRKRRQRNILATVMLSQGTPMMLAGDEGGHSQGGNNNAYCQDNETSWLDWATMDDELIAGLQELRNAIPREALDTQDGLDVDDPSTQRDAMTDVKQILLSKLTRRGTGA